MLKSYLKIGFRHLVGNKIYSFINIGGLSMGMAVAMIIGLWVYDELSFNRYHQNYDRIAQLMKTGVDENGDPWAGGFSLAYPLVDELRTNYGSNFKHFVPALQRGETILTVGDTKISAMGQVMDSGAPEMLSLDMLSGSREGLKEPMSILISESTSLKLFGHTATLGQTIRTPGNHDVVVTGVYRDIPMNSYFHHLEFITPWERALLRMAWISEQNWENHFLYIYCEIAPGKTFDEVQANIGPSLINAIKDLPNLEQLIGQQPVVTVVPMADWHLRSSFSWPNRGKPDAGPANLVWLVAIIGAFVLILACINFMNLSTARSEKRAREVGVRKSMGSLRRQLISQFFAESYVVVLVASVLAIIITWIALPWFNQLSAKDISFPWTNVWFWLFTALFIGVTGLLAGSYPALYLSSFNPVKTLKGTFRTGRLASLPRKVMVVTQFAVSVTLAISTIVVYRQIMYAKDRPVGYTRDGLILIQKKSPDFFGKTELLRNELKRTGMVEEIAESGGKTTAVWSNNSGFEWEGKDPTLKDNFGTLGISAEYGTTVRWEFTAGRDFSPDIASDSSAVVINESAARVIGAADILNKSIRWSNKMWQLDKEFHVVGVVKDMVMNSPYKPTLPTIFLLRSTHYVINIRIRPGASTAEALAQIETVFKKVIPSAPFEFEFADDAYAAKFAAEDRIASLASVFSTLSILISCLGLFGLASFVAEQRTKEIGIRKVVGATVYDLWKMLSVDFVVVVLISGLIAIPVAWYALSTWLAQYDYRIDLPWWVFVFSIAGAVALTLATVSYQAIRAARMNPVTSLRSE